MRICGMTWVTQPVSCSTCFCKSCSCCAFTCSCLREALEAQVLLGRHFLGYSTWKENIGYN